MATKKPKPPIPGRPKPTPAKKKPAEKRVPVTSVTPRATVKKPSAKQVAGTRKVVANLAGVTPIGRGIKAAAKAGQSARSFATLYPNPVKRGAKAARALQNKAAKEFGMSKGTTVGKAKALKKTRDSDYKLGKGKNKNLRTNMENAYATGIVGELARMSKKNARRTPPKPPVKKKK